MNTQGASQTLQTTTPVQRAPDPRFAESLRLGHTYHLPAFAAEKPALDSQDALEACQYALETAFFQSLKRFNPDPVKVLEGLVDWCFSQLDYLWTTPISNRKTDSEDRQATVPGHRYRNGPKRRCRDPAELAKDFEETDEFC